MLEWVHLDTLSDLEDSDEKSFICDIMIFKHSTTCPISHIAKRRIEDNWTSELNKVIPYYLDLKAHREISSMIAEKYQVHHESPQVLIVRKGSCIYDASHLDITTSEIMEAIV